MTERPILFAGSMVRAIQRPLGAHPKTNTRRVMKTMKHPDFGCDIAPSEIRGEPQHVIERLCPYGKPGDRLWVRETWCPVHPGSWEPLAHDEKMSPLWAYDAVYRADYPTGDYDYDGKWRPSIHMPRKFSRITLEITEVRVERLQAISNEDARAEGVDCAPHRGGTCGMADTGFDQCAICPFRNLWNSINGPRGLVEMQSRGLKTNPYIWDANPYVWVIVFRKMVKP